MPTTVFASAPVRALLAEAVDYAGLFPPASLDLTRAVAEYLSIRTGDDRWALGRFIIPAGRLAELREVARQEPLSAHAAIPIPLAALIGADTADDVHAVERWNQELSGFGSVEAVEARATSAVGARAVLAALPRGWTRYVEVVPGERMVETLDAVLERGAFAKLRMGGVTPEAFPGPEAVLDFLEACAQRRLPFKATAGLHHPVRGEYRLTYAADAPTAVMYGYLNLFAAAALLWARHPRAAARTVLLESDPAAFRLDATALRVGGQAIGTDVLASVRAEFAHGFGSCSFREPVDELATMVSA